MKKNTYPVHPLAAAFPEMSAEEFADLKQSVADHGLRHKIVLLDGQILDGRNRDAACVELGIPPIFRDFDPTIDGDLPVAFVADENLNRRNLSVSQRAAIAAELEPYFAEAIAKEKAAAAEAKLAKKAAKGPKPAAGADVPTPSAVEPGAPAGPAADPVKETTEQTIARLSKIHNLDPGGSTMKGALASAKGGGLEDNPFEEGHPARDLWKRGWEMETARQMMTDDQDDDLQIGPPKEPTPTAGVEVQQTEDPPTVVDESKTAPAGETARDKAAAVTGVSGRSVQDAKNLKDKAPEEFEKVKSGEKTLNKAKADAELNKTSISPYRQECADMLEGTHGEAFSQAIRDVTVLKSNPELEAFMKLTPSHQKEVIPFVVKTWKVADAIKFLRGEFDAGTTVGELISFANAKGGEAAVEIGEFTITIEKSGVKAPDTTGDPKLATTAAAEPDTATAGGPA